MKIPILPVVALLSLLALHAAQGASLGNQESTTYSDYLIAPATEGFKFLNLNQLQSAFKSDDFLNWHVISDMFKKAFPFINWEMLPKVKGLRSAVPDSQ